MAIRTKKSIFYHIPKTGGTWVNYALRYSTKSYKNSIYKRPDTYCTTTYSCTYWKRYIAHMLGLRRAHETIWGISRKDKEGLFSFAFVREPVAWYKSFWADRKHARNQPGCQKQFLLDFAWDRNFDKFVSNSLEMFPYGALTIIYQCFLGEDGKALDFVGKQENLKQDLIKALSLANERFNPEVINSLHKINVRASKTNYKNHFSIGSDLIKKIHKKEKWIYQTFY